VKQCQYHFYRLIGLCLLQIGGKANIYPFWGQPAQEKAIWHIICYHIGNMWFSAQRNRVTARLRALREKIAMNA